MAKPCIVQQYYNHDGNFYKAYVIDQDVMVYKRSSLPNLDLNIYTGGINDSQQQQHDQCIVSKDNSGPIDSTEDKDTNRRNDSNRYDSSEDTVVAASSGNCRKRKLLFRSVAFDSRCSYPTINDFIDTDTEEYGCTKTIQDDSSIVYNNSSFCRGSDTATSLLHNNCTTNNTTEAASKLPLPSTSSLHHDNCVSGPLYGG